MRTYSIHIRRQGLDIERDFVVIKEGFNWPAFLFNGFWALWCRQWLAALVTFLVLVLVFWLPWLIGGTKLDQIILSLGCVVIFGMLANDIRRWHLERADFVEVGIYIGHTSDEALFAYLSEARTQSEINATDRI